MPNTPILALPFLMPSQAQKHVTHNEALVQLDALVQLTVLSRTETAPPAGTADGARYLVAAGATGDWQGQDHAVAVQVDGSWQFHAPIRGWIAYLEAEGFPVVFDGAVWTALIPELQNLPGLGVGASYDAINRLSLSGAASLFSHAGAGHQLKINKAGPTETATLLYQSNWSGRVEAGLAGNDDYSIKVSPDGSSFAEALRISGTTGQTQVTALNSGFADIDPDSVASLSPPATGGLVMLTAVGPAEPQVQHSALLAYDTGATPALLALCAGPQTEVLGAQTLTGTSAASGFTGLAVQGGQIQIENRSGAALRYSYSFLC